MNSPKSPSPSFWSRAKLQSPHLAIEPQIDSAEKAAAALAFSAQIHQLPEDRKQLIFRIRRQIAENRYDSDEKLDLALDRMIDQLHAGR
jgi:hypothetical protein